MSFTESHYENAVLQLFQEQLGYNYLYGPDVERDYHSPLYEDALLSALRRINRDLPEEAIAEAVYKLKILRAAPCCKRTWYSRTTCKTACR